MKTAPIVERLEAQVRDFRSVDGVAGLSAIDEVSFRPPAAFVAPLTETAEDNARPGSGAVRQVETRGFAVLIIIAGKARQKSAINDQLSDLIDGVKSALIGWNYPEAMSTTVYRRGRLLRAAEGRVAWQMEFSYRIHQTA